jgi:hypothetical protein
LRQLFTIIFEVFIQKTQDIVGGEVIAEALLPENNSYSKVSQVFQECEDAFSNQPIFHIVEDIIQNLATALFIHEQGSHEVSSSSSKKTSSTSTSSVNSLVGGMMGTISN